MTRGGPSGAQARCRVYNVTEAQAVNQHDQSQTEIKDRQQGRGRGSVIFVNENENGLKT